MAAVVAGRRRIAIAMSGGVDSSVVAYLLKHHQHQFMESEEEDIDLLGLHMSNWNSADEDGAYCAQSEKDANDTMDVCQRLDIPMHRVSFAAEYWTGVFEPFLHGLNEGLTPNPDVDCNRIVKFDAMTKYASNCLNADWIATGHYARLWNRQKQQSTKIPDFISQSIVDTPEEEWLTCSSSSSWGNPNAPLLLSALDSTKDQSYFLSTVFAEQFRNVLFPLGNLSKNIESHSDDRQIQNSNMSKFFDDTILSMSVREIASFADLSTATKRDSMGICFIGKRNFSQFISEYLPQQRFGPGTFIDVDTGEVVGSYHGSTHFTMGQGARISGASKKWFVVERDGPTVFVCNDTHHPSLYTNELYVDAFHWVVGKQGTSHSLMPPPPPPPLLRGESMRAFCRTTHLQPLTPCTVSRYGESIHIHFDKPLRAITPGQIAALYIGRNGLICLGGGPIRPKASSCRNYEQRA